MYRKRLRSSTGCMRCKSRHSKCDEKRPQCSFCLRYGLVCIWPSRWRPRAKSGQWPVTESVPGGQLTRNGHSACLDPFHVLPVHYTEDFGVIVHSLHSFFVLITENTLPFDVADTHRELTRGWLASVHADEAVCSSFVTYCARFYSERITQRHKLVSLSLYNEAHSLLLLRQRIERNEPVTEETLLAAALHFFIATLSTESVTQLSHIARGTSALVASRGGSRVIMRNVSPSTRQSLMFVDIFSSLLTAQRPFLELVEIPSKPPSYDSLIADLSVDSGITNLLGQEITDVLDDLRFALFFRSPSQQTRSLSSEESWYLFMLLQRISYRLCNQQSRLTTTQSLSAIVVYGLILVKEVILLDIIQHPILPVTILRRLQVAISNYKGKLQGGGLSLALWASTIALVGPEFEPESKWALDFITGILADRYDPVWPEDWADNTRQELQQILWHHRIEVAFTTMCTKINHLRSHLTDRIIGQSSLYE